MLAIETVTRLVLATASFVLVTGFSFSARADSELTIPVSVDVTEFGLRAE